MTNSSQTIEDELKRRKRTRLFFASLGIAGSYVLDFLLYALGTYSKWNAAWVVLRGMIIVSLMFWRSEIKVGQPASQPEEE